MFLLPHRSRSRLVSLAAAGLVLAVSFACSDEPSNSLTGPQLQSAGPQDAGQPDVQAALAAQDGTTPG